MVRRAIIFTGYRFYVGPFGNDFLEGHHYTMEKLLGKGVVNFYNKRGGLMYVMFIGDPSMVKKAEILCLIEQKCGILFYDSIEQQYQAQYELNLKSMYGDKLVIKE